MAERVAPSACPFCASPNDAASAVDGTDTRPAPGDLAVCAYCRELVQYGADLALCRPTVDTLADLAADREAMAQVRRAGALLSEWSAMGEPQRRAEVERARRRRAGGEAAP